MNLRGGDQRVLKRYSTDLSVSVSIQDPMAPNTQPQFSRSQLHRVFPSPFFTRLGGSTRFSKLSTSLLTCDRNEDGARAAMSLKLFKTSGSPVKTKIFLHQFGMIVLHLNSRW